jgi:hypothetical protein
MAPCLSLSLLLHPSISPSFGMHILCVPRERYLDVHPSDPTLVGVEGALCYGLGKAVVAQFCEGEALLCWMMAKK